MNRLAYILAATAWIVAALAPAAAQPGSADPAYRIGPKDLVRIRVFEEPELNVDRRVSEEGTIEFQPVGEVKVSGLTTTDLAKRLKQALEAKYLQRASVSVELLEFRSRPISVIGSVKQPGNLPFSGRWTLLEALTAAGGLAENHGGTIYVLRRATNGLSDQVAIPVEGLLVKADPKLNLPLFSNDLVNVPARVEVTVYCLGELRQPGALEFESTERITLLSAVARAGGLTDRASKKIIVRRRASDGQSKEIVADYKRILAGKEPDIELHEGDVIVVKESFF